MMSKPKDYKFQYQKRRFRLRVYPMHMCVKIFMDGLLRDITVQNVSSKNILEYYFLDERKQEHKITVQRKHHWFKYNYEVFYNGQTVFKTIDTEPVIAD